MTEPIPVAEPAPAAAQDIVARADFQYRWRSWAFALLLLGIGLWSLNDGFIVYPRENAAWERMADRPVRPPHDPPGILFNQFAGVIFTAVSIPVLLWRERRSRGEYRLSGDTLRVPGHEPVALNQVRGLDLVRWDRKGIAVVEYEHSPGGGPPRRLTLNDMIYQRQATDLIVARIEAHLNALDAQPAAPEPPAAEA